MIKVPICSTELFVVINITN